MVELQKLPLEEVMVPDSVILTFSHTILEYLLKKKNFQAWKWKGEDFSPYSRSQKSLKTTNKARGAIACFIPSMGASPLIAFCEELIFFGAKRIILICATWSLGEKFLQKGEFHLPNYAFGIDGTSFHYGNQEGKIKSEYNAFKTLKTLLEAGKVKWKVGGIGSCEAIYRITEEMVERYQKLGCLSMDNGEIASLFSLAKEYHIPIGALVHPYLNLDEGWNSAYIDQMYVNTCKKQTDIALKALELLTN
jgi:uridine phosphorylase